MYYFRSSRSRDEWESAALHNANTRANGLLPLWGPQVPESAFASCLARHNNYLQECTTHRFVTYGYCISWSVRMFISFLKIYRIIWCLLEVLYVTFTTTPLNLIDAYIFEWKCYGNDSVTENHDLLVWSKMTSLLKEILVWPKTVDWLEFNIKIFWMKSMIKSRQYIHEILDHMNIFRTAFLLV